MSHYDQIYKNALLCQVKLVVVQKLQHNLNCGFSFKHIALDIHTLQNIIILSANHYMIISHTF